MCVILWCYFCFIHSGLFFCTPSHNLLSVLFTHPLVWSLFSPSYSFFAICLLWWHSIISDSGYIFLSPLGCRGLWEGEFLQTAGVPHIHTMLVFGIHQPEVHLLVSQLSPNHVFCITFGVGFWPATQDNTLLIYLMHVLLTFNWLICFLSRETSWFYPHVYWYMYSNVHLFSTCVPALLLTTISSDAEMSYTY